MIVLGGSSHLDPWLITMVIVSPLSEVIPFPNGLGSMAKINGGDPITTYPSPGMILQVVCVQTNLLAFICCFLEFMCWQTRPTSAPPVGKTPKQVVNRIRESGPQNSRRIQVEEFHSNFAQNDIHQITTNQPQQKHLKKP